MENLLGYNTKMINGLDRVLKCLSEGKDYNDKPPKKAENLPVLTNEEMNDLLLNEVGETTKVKSNYNYRREDIDLKIEDLQPKAINFPSSDDLDGLEVFGIDGSNQRLDNPCFHFFLARSAIVNFRYTKGPDKPYFYTRKMDVSAIVQVDGNIFTNSIKTITYEKLNKLIKQKSKDSEKISIYRHLKQNTNQYPFLLGYNGELEEKSPKSHVLGWAVKFMNVLELQCLEQIEPQQNANFVCIKDGPLFSSSSTLTDNLDGLKNILSWKKGVLVAVSKRITDARFLLDIFCQFPNVLDYYFPNQHITLETIKSLGTDALILPRILSPGERTPLIKAIPIARRNYVKEHEEFFPLVCYYMRKNKPHNVIRLEVPIFMFNRDKEAVYKAIAVVAWQFELGEKAPLVQLEADKQCQIGSEIELLRYQTLSMINKKKLNLPTYY